MKTPELINVMYNNGEPNGTFWMIWVIFLLLTLFLQVKVYQKAGLPWYAAVIPFYSSYKMQQMALGKDKGWTFLLYFIPIAGAIFGIYSMYKFFQSFDMPGWLGIISAFIPPVLLVSYGYMGLSDNVEYIGPAIA